MERRIHDVLIIGSGAAGLRAAIAARQEGADVLVISKAAPGKSTCTIFSGGVFASSGAGLPTKPHRQRTLKAGRGINQTDLVDVLAEEAPARLQEMLGWGLSATYHKGYLHCQDRPPLWGREIIRCLLTRNQHLGTTFIGGLQAVRLQALQGGFSLLAFASASRRWLTVSATAVVLATGGAAALYLRHDNPKSMLGDGYGLALEAGATLQDMEFVQFYPVALAEPGLPPFLIPPAFADLGRVTNNQGDDILAKYEITEKPVAERARDLFSRALFQEIYREQNTVWLDLRRLADEDWQIDPFSASTHHILGVRYGARQRSIRIAPVAHHVMGGVCIDPSGATTVPGLFAAGEVTGGLHGANRMGGNALSETLVFGRRAGKSAAGWAGEKKEALARLAQTQSLASPPAAPPASKTSEERLKALQQILWEAGGIIRKQRGLAHALHWVQQNEIKDDLKARFAFRTAMLVLQAALKRQESRGAHYREDFPAADEKNWRGHLQVRLDKDGQLQWHFRPIA